MGESSTMSPPGLVLKSYSFSPTKHTQLRTQDNTHLSIKPREMEFAWFDWIYVESASCRPHTQLFQRTRTHGQDYLKLFIWGIFVDVLHSGEPNQDGKTSFPHLKIFGLIFLYIRLPINPRLHM